MQFAVNAIADLELVLKRLEVNVRGAQLNGVLQHLVDKTDDGGLVLLAGIEVGILRVFIHHLDGFLLVEGADGVGAHAEALFDFALDGFAGGEDRLEVQAGQRFQRVQSLRGKEAAGGHLHQAVHAAEWQQFLLQQNPGWKQREQLAIRFDLFQRCVVQAVFSGQPAQDFLLAGQRQSGERSGVQGGQLPERDHALQQRS